MQRYREQETRLTHRLHGLIFVVVAAAAFLGYAVRDGYALHSSTATATVGTLTCLAGALQVRASRNRVRQLLRSGEAGKIAQRIAEPAAPQPAGFPPLFAQQYCRVNRTSVGGRLQAGQVPPAFQVTVRDKWLTVTEAPFIPVLRAAAAEIQILAPRRQHLGACTALRLDGQTWVVEFSGVYNAERHAGFLRQALTFGSLRKSIRRGREVNDRFTTALLASGASQQY
jgi:hypothetical protein